MASACAARVRTIDSSAISFACGLLPGLIAASYVDGSKVSHHGGLEVLSTAGVRSAPQSSFMRTAVFSIISPNYRHSVRVLMASAEKHHPEWDRFVLLVGGAAGEDRHHESFTTVPLEDLSLPNPRQFYFRY